MTGAIDWNTSFTLQSLPSAFPNGETVFYDTDPDTGNPCIVRTFKSNGSTNQTVYSYDSTNNPNVLNRVANSGLTAWEYFDTSLYMQTFWGAWQDLTLSNSWTNFGGADPPCQYRVSKTGEVELRGLVKGGVIDGSTAITTLPVLAQPMYTTPISTMTGNYSYGCLYIKTNGEVIPESGNAAYIWLNCKYSLT